MKTDVHDEVATECAIQRAVRGDASYPDGTGGPGSVLNAALARATRHAASSAGCLTFADVLLDEVGRTIATTDPVLLRARLIQVAACSVYWAEAIERRRKLQS